MPPSSAPTSGALLSENLLFHGTSKPTCVPLALIHELFQHYLAAWERAGLRTRESVCFGGVK